MCPSFVFLNDLSHFMAIQKKKYLVFLVHYGTPGCLHGGMGPNEYLSISKKILLRTKYTLFA